MISTRLLRNSQNICYQTSRVLIRALGTENIPETIGSRPTKPLSKTLLYSPKDIKSTWLTSVVREVIPRTSQTISDRGQSVDNLEISVSYCNPVPPVFDEKSPTKDVVGKKRIDDSWLELYLPYSQHSYLRDAMATFDGSNMRYGKLLEVLDALAADVAYRHIGGKKGDMYIVTAAVDRMKILSHISLQNDFKLQGYLTYVGKSSLNVTIDMFSVTAQGEEILVGSTEFIMVARQGSKALHVSGLLLHNDECKAVFAAGQQSVEIRKKKAAMDFTIQPPRSEEMNVIHALYLQSKRIQNVNEYANRANAASTTSSSSSYMWMKETVFKNTQFMHLQNRNVHGKIFGGFVMRIAYELAHVASRCFIGDNQAEFVYVDEISFVKPVNIGSIVEFSAMVIYNEDNCFVVKVTAEDVSPINTSRTRTNEMTFIFRSNAKHVLPQVIPSTYEETISYLEGKRALDEVKAELL